MEETFYAKSVKWIVILMRKLIIKLPISLLVMRTYQTILRESYLLLTWFIDWRTTRRWWTEIDEFAGPIIEQAARRLLVTNAINTWKNPMQLKLRDNASTLASKLQQIKVVKGIAQQELQTCCRVFCNRECVSAKLQQTGNRISTIELMMRMF